MLGLYVARISKCHFAQHTNYVQLHFPADGPGQCVGVYQGECSPVLEGKLDEGSYYPCQPERLWPLSLLTSMKGRSTLKTLIKRRMRWIKLHEARGIRNDKARV